MPQPGTNAKNVSVNYALRSSGSVTALTARRVQYHSSAAGDHRRVYHIGKLRHQYLLSMGEGNGLVPAQVSLRHRPIEDMPYARPVADQCAACS